MSRKYGRDSEENIGSFYMGRMRPPPKPERMLPKGMLTTVSLVIFAVIIWYAYPEGQEKYSGLDIPVIQADSSPYKFKPDDPGGIDVPHQDSTVFDPLERKAAKVEKLMPAPENPVDKTVAAKAPIDKKTPKLNLDLQMKQVAAGTEKVVSTKPPAPVTAPKKPANDVVQPLKKPGAKPVVKKETAAKPADGVIWDVWIRLGSYRNLAGAKEDWDILRRKFPQYLGRLEMRTVKVDLAGKGVFHRLEAGKVSEARAKEICKDLSKSNPGGCLVVK